MNVTVKKYIAVYVNEANEGSDNYVVPTPHLLKDIDETVLIGNTYDEITSFINDDIDYWRSQRPTPTNFGYEKQDNTIIVWDDEMTVHYKIEMIEVEIDIEVK